MEPPLPETIDLLLEKYRAVWAMTRGKGLATAEDSDAVAAFIAGRQKILDEIKALTLPKLDPETLPRLSRIKYKKLRRLGRFIREEDLALQERIRRRLAAIQEEMKWRGFVQAQALAGYTRQKFAVPAR